MRWAPQGDVWFSSEIWWSGRKDGGGKWEKKERKTRRDGSHSGQDSGGGPECTHKPCLTH